MVLHSLSNLTAEEAGACRREFVYVYKCPVIPVKKINFNVMNEQVVKETITSLVNVNTTNQSDEVR